MTIKAIKDVIGAFSFISGITFTQKHLVPNRFDLHESINLRSNVVIRTHTERYRQTGAMQIQTKCIIVR